jgi:hypothetical protein
MPAVASRLDSHEIWKSLFLPAEADVALLELRRRARAQDPEAQWLPRQLDER